MAGRPPHDDDGTYCPKWQKPCVEVCHTCKMWRPFNVVGKEGTRYDHWDCTLALGTPLTVENTGVTAEVAKSVQQSRNLTFELAKIQIAAEYHDKPETLAAVMNAFKLLEAKEMVQALAAPKAL